MELSPQAVAAATFKTVKRGYDPDEVRAYLVEVSSSLESSHQQATAMEARARAAIAKLQDATQNGGVALAPMPEEADTISRALLLAQRTADTAVAEARAEAAAMMAKAEAEAAIAAARATNEAATATSSARAEAAVLVEEARAQANRLLEEAEQTARRAKDDQHLRAEAEVASLAREKAALLSDLDRLDQHVRVERDRIRDASGALRDLADRVPAGLGESSRPDISDVGESGVADARPVGSMPPPTSNDVNTTGRIPITPGQEPLISDRPSSPDQVRSMWQEAEKADLNPPAAADGAPTSDDDFPGPNDETPPSGSATATDVTPADGVVVADGDES